MNFEEFQKSVFVQYGAGKFQDALVLLASPPDQLTSTQHSRTDFWRACLHTQLNEFDAAVAALSQIQERGDWLAPAQLEHDPDLLPLREHPGFQALLSEWQEKQRKAAQRHHPTLTLLGSTEASHGSLIALHGNTGSPDALRPLYADLVDRSWRIALAGSGQYGGPEAFVWDDAAQADAEAQAWAQELGGSPIWAGYSAGASVILRNVLTSTVPAAGVLAVAPSVRADPTWWQEDLAHIPIALILGEADPFTARASALAERLRALDIPVREWTHAGGHAHPENWGAVRDEALSWLASKS